MWLLKYEIKQFNVLFIDSPSIDIKDLQYASKCYINTSSYYKQETCYYPSYNEYTLFLFIHTKLFINMENAKIKKQ